MGKQLALLSAYDKKNIVEFARELIVLDFEILASGGTAKALVAAGVPVTSVEEYTGQGPVLEHRVVTLHPKIHGGLLSTYQMAAEMRELGWRRIELVYVNLYPLEEAVRIALSVKGNSLVARLGDVIDKMDIGGPAMLRAAGKGLRYVLHDSDQFQRALSHLRGKAAGSDEVSEEDIHFRVMLLNSVLRRTRDYDAVFADFLHGEGVVRI